jgi:hypothetical protein
LKVKRIDMAQPPAVRTARVALAAALLLAGCGPGGARGPAGGVDIGVSGRANANPSIAAQGRFVALVWGAPSDQGPTGIYLATSRDAGAAFGSPVRVNDDGSVASLSAEQPPRVALLPRAGQDPAIVVLWTARGDSGTRLFSARSNDGGGTFSAPEVVTGSDAPGSRGWESMTAIAGDDVGMIWLDHRELAGPGQGSGVTHAGHEHGARPAQQADSVSRAQLSKLYFARLGADGGPREITGGVCYCCKTAVASGADGSLYAAWRHVYAGNIRDIAFTVSRDGGTTFAPPIRVSEDRWELDGCPENGPALAVDTKNRVHVAWPTLVAGESGSEPTLALFYAMSPDGGQFTPRERIPTEGVPRHVQIAAGFDDGLIVSWDEQAGSLRRIALARGVADDGGAVRFTRETLNEQAPAVSPVMARTEDGLVIAWTSGKTGESRIRVERLR